VSYMKPDEGVAHIALGLGKIVVDGGVALRFSPKYPEFLPQFSSVENILKNAQRYFYALRLDTEHKNYIETTDSPSSSDYKSETSSDYKSETSSGDKSETGSGDKPKTSSCDKSKTSSDYKLETDFELAKLDVDDAIDHISVRKLLSTYIPEDNRIFFHATPKGYPVLTFASILKMKTFPLGEILSELLEIGKHGMGCPVEVEFAVNLPDSQKPEFSLLQIRPMMVARHNMDVDINQKDIDNAFCYSDKAMGSSQITKIYHIIYVKPETFDTSKTVEIAEEINKINTLFDKQKNNHKDKQENNHKDKQENNHKDKQENNHKDKQENNHKDKQENNHKYLLIGPGRWGSTDHWLGIPVKWSYITNVGTIIETASDKLNADPSQGSHFFHNITSLGLNYLGIPMKDKNFIDWQWLNELSVKVETRFLRYIRLSDPVVLKINGRESNAVILKQGELSELPLP
ncbi:MAG: hypothetical protein HQK67_06580, partial [Desulfamplus sp.]|nr:hypothetical protein [Desulfamplus sp.]